jgi:hypothetical protein
MSMKFQMTRQGMQSMYSLAWRQGVVRAAAARKDPIFSSAGADEAEEGADADMALLSETVVSPGRLAPIDASLQTAAQRDRQLANRVLDLLRLGYTGF